jgi:hypothetical protein
MQSPSRDANSHSASEEIPWHWSLFWDNWMQSTPVLHICLVSILILYSHQCLSIPSYLFLLGVLNKILYNSQLQHVCLMFYTSHLSFSSQQFLLVNLVFPLIKALHTLSSCTSVFIHVSSYFVPFTDCVCSLSTNVLTYWQTI